MCRRKVESDATCNQGTRIIELETLTACCNNKQSTELQHTGNITETYEPCSVQKVMTDQEDLIILAKIPFPFSAQTQTMLTDYLCGFPQHIQVNAAKFINTRDENFLPTTGIQNLRIQSYINSEKLPNQRYKPLLHLKKMRVHIYIVQPLLVG